MAINLNDRGLVTSYVQIVLRDFSGLSVRVPSSRKNKFIKSWYEITATRPIKVTGVYDLDTYAAASVFMIINYPNEEFPVRYDINRNSVIKTPFNKSKLSSTISWVKGWFEGSINEEIYKNHNPVSSEVFDWSTFSKYFSDLSRLEDLLSRGASFGQIFNESVVSFIVHNMDVSLDRTEVVSLPDRVLSYFFNEVVTPSSKRDEIYRIQKKLYSKISRSEHGIFTKDFEDRVKKVQQDFITAHTVVKGSQKEVSLPEGFEGFKVTGYVDPWTEMILDGGVR